MRHGSLRSSLQATWFNLLSSKFIRQPFLMGNVDISLFFSHKHMCQQTVTSLSLHFRISIELAITCSFILCVYAFLDISAHSGIAISLSDILYSPYLNLLFNKSTDLYSGYYIISIKKVHAQAQIYNTATRPFLS